MKSLVALWCLLAFAVVVQAQRSVGASANSDVPVPPKSAKVFPDIDEMGRWESCGTAACAGGSGNSSFEMTQNQPSPSKDGNSVLFQVSGSFGNALWWKKLGPYNNATNFLWDFYFYLDDASVTSGQALEYDVFQVIDGYRFMMGSQCNYAAGVWDIWNDYTHHWVHTSIACPKFKPNTWHRIQLYTTTNHEDRTYTFRTLVVDGKAYTLNETYPAKYMKFVDNVGVQWQLDANKGGGQYREWVDKASLTIW